MRRWRFHEPRMSVGRRALLFGSALLLTFPALGQDFDLSWWTIDGGGEMWTSGGDYEMSGTIGQPDVQPPPAMAGGGFELVGGFWPVVEHLPGDLNGDCRVDLSDLGILLANYGLTEGVSYADGDIDGDGDVDLSDLGILLSRYGASC